MYAMAVVFIIKIYYKYCCGISIYNKTLLKKHYKCR